MRASRRYQGVLWTCLLSSLALLFIYLALVFKVSVAFFGGLPQAPPARAFEPPSLEIRRAAVGDLRALSVELQRAFSPESPAFDPIPKPGPNDWLAAHEEEDQSFEAFKASRPNRPDRRRCIIYLQPLGEFSAGHSPSLEKLRDFAAASFSKDVKALPPAPVSAEFTTRRNPHTANSQILTGDVLKYLKKRIPDDAFCILAVTMEDLYPEPSWNFVFGQASLRDRVGVYSFARYDPAFHNQPRTAGYETLVLRRSCKVLAHETGHMFGLAHCTYFNCLMNGSNHLAESDQRPLHLCPVCLRKLQWSVGFVPLARYIALEKATRSLGFDDEADWISAQVKALRE